MVVPFKRDDGVVDDAEVASRVRSGDLVKFVPGSERPRPEALRALRERARNWKPPKSNGGHTTPFTVTPFR